jgi:hypothetical protein
MDAFAPCCWAFHIGTAWGFAKDPPSRMRFAMATSHQIVGQTGPRGSLDFAFDPKIGLNDSNALEAKYRWP